MEKYIALLALLLFNSVNSQENNNSYIYQVYNIQKDNLEKLNNYNNIVARSYDTIEYKFWKDKYVGMFSPLEKLNNSQTIKLDLNEIFVKTQGEFYYDYEKGVFENRKNTLGKTFIIEINKNDYKWELTNETERCLNYICKKAVFIRSEKGLNESRDYKISVWYTDEYPNNIAPFGLIGLNGLITKINFNGNTEVILKKMYFESNISIQPFKSGLRVSLKEFNEIVEENMNRFRRSHQNGVDKSQ